MKTVPDCRPFRELRREMIHDICTGARLASLADEFPGLLWVPKVEVPVANAPAFLAEAVAQELANRSPGPRVQRLYYQIHGHPWQAPPFAVAWHEDRDGRHYVLASTGDTDVGAIARGFGGDGNPDQARFTETS